MPTFSSFAAFGQAIDKMEKSIENDRKLWALGMAKRAQAIAEAAASADLGGDPKFSGWKPPLSTQLKSITDGVAMIPTRSSAGPWTVAERGRHQGNAGGFSGPGINRKSGLTSRTKSGGLRKVRTVSGKRWNGTTKGFHTATKAVDRMQVELTPIAEKAVHQTIIRHFDVD
jgi:hypothetical protein